MLHLCTQAFVSELEEEFDPKPFFIVVRSFYITTSNKMLKKFPFGDTVLHGMGITNPKNTSTYDFSTVARLAKRFRQLGLNDSESIDGLRSEFADFNLSLSELTTVEPTSQLQVMTSQDLEDFGMKLARCWKVKISITRQADDGLPTSVQV